MYKNAMAEPLNPFFLNSYHGPEYFCDREHEKARLVSNVRNGINTTLLSIRRMGKTGMIHHAFHELTSKKIRCVYADIYATGSLREFTNTIAAAILQTFPEKNPLGKTLMNLLKTLRPVISFDPLTGSPEVNFDFAKPAQYEQSLGSLFNFLESQNAHVVVAIDEFQQIALYQEKNMEAMLRTMIQPLKQVQFIFSGSNKHLLSQIFSDSKRPFFSSTQAIYLQPIADASYTPFIQEMFKKGKKQITEDAVTFVLEFTRSHTYYTQAVCNRLYSDGGKQVTAEVVRQVCSTLLSEYESIFYQYRSLLTSIQWNLLKAVAKEDKLYQPSAKRFLQSHNVGTPANVQRALEALLNKEMIYREQDEGGNYYRVYDCFLARWLENK